MSVRSCQFRDLNGAGGLDRPLGRAPTGAPVFGVSLVARWGGLLQVLPVLAGTTTLSRERQSAKLCVHNRYLLCARAPFDAIMSNRKLLISETLFISEN